MEESGGVQGAGGIVLVAKEDIGFAIFCKRGEALGKGVEFRGSVAAIAAEAVAAEGGGVDVRGGEVVGVGDAESGVAGLEGAIDLFVEPAFVAELEGNGWGWLGLEGGQVKKGLEAREIGFEVGRELEEDGAELAGVAGREERVEKPIQVFSTVTEAAEVRDALRGFKAETKAGGRGGKPAVELGTGRQRAEGVVDLNGSEDGGVVVEKGFHGDLGGVEARFPGGICPTRSADEEILRGGREVFSCGGDVFWGSRHRVSIALRRVDGTLRSVLIKLRRFGAASGI